MTYTNQDFNNIYQYLGFQFYVTVEPEIVSIIVASQETPAGNQSDNTLETQVKQIVANLQNIDQQIMNLSNLDWISNSSTGATINPARGDYLLRKQGRALIKQLCIIFALRGVRQDWYGLPSKISYDDMGMSILPDRDDY